jgi:hypothetical protein
MTTQASTRGAGAAMFALPGVSDGADRGQVVDQMLHRASSLGFDAWWRRAVAARGERRVLRGPHPVGRHRSVRPPTQRVGAL